LAKTLGVTIEVLSGWLAGDDVPPKIYLSVLDIVAMGSLGSANLNG
jgi:DNA-binding transcriptional regulator YiaG